MGNVSLKVLEKSLNFLLKNGYEPILGDPGADSGDEGKSKRVEKCGAKKSKERREEPLGTMSYQTSSRRSPPFWLLIGARKLVFFWHQLEARTAATVWNGLVRHCPQRLFSPFFSFLRAKFFQPLRLSIVPTFCPWVSKDGTNPVYKRFVNVQSG